MVSNASSKLLIGAVCLAMVGCAPTTGQHDRAYHRAVVIANSDAFADRRKVINARDRVRWGNASLTECYISQLADGVSARPCIDRINRRANEVRDGIYAIFAVIGSLWLVGELAGDGDGNCKCVAICICDNGGRTDAKVDNI